MTVIRLVVLGHRAEMTGFAGSQTKMFVIVFVFLRFCCEKPPFKHRYGAWVM